VSGLVSDPEVIAEVAHIGIMFLLFLMGLDLDPKELLHAFRRTTVVTLASSTVFALLGGAVAWVWGFEPVECLVAGAAVSFSSTIIGLKLLPTTVLHHQRMGQVMISVLLLQDLMAIGMLLLVQGGGHMDDPLREALTLVLAPPLLIGLAALLAKFVILRLIGRFERINEYVFLVPIGWCLGLAMAAERLGLSHEIGAFVAGVTLAQSPMALYIVDRLKPLRDFFRPWRSRIVCVGIESATG
jgi:Kef-type K+ transport system membrane component KefB